MDIAKTVRELHRSVDGLEKDLKRAKTPQDVGDVYAGVRELSYAVAEMTEDYLAHLANDMNALQHLIRVVGYLFDDNKRLKSMDLEENEGYDIRRKLGKINPDRITDTKFWRKLQEVSAATRDM